MTKDELYKQSLARLTFIYDKDEAKAILNLLFEYIKSNETNLQQDDAERANKINQAMDRLVNHEPVQYVLGEAWFYKLRFKVNHAVLIPRPETEELVEIALRFLKPRQTTNVLDIGTGSGCIAVAISKYANAANVTAVDVSEDALKLARQNAQLNGCDAHFIELDFLSDELPADLTNLDLIISNPPYIPYSERHQMDVNVTSHEPEQALFVPDEDPLIFYRRICEVAKNRLANDGMICLEVHQSYGEAVMELFKENGYAVVLKNDMSGKGRFVLVSHSR